MCVPGVVDNQFIGYHCGAGGCNEEAKPLAEQAKYDPQNPAWAVDGRMLL